MSNDVLFFLNILVTETVGHQTFGNTISIGEEKINFGIIAWNVTTCYKTPPMETMKTNCWHISVLCASIDKKKTIKRLLSWNQW